MLVFLPLCFDRASHRPSRHAYCALFSVEASNSHKGAYDRYTQYHENRQQPALRWSSQEGCFHKLDALRQREKLHDALHRLQHGLEGQGLAREDQHGEVRLSARKPARVACSTRCRRSGAAYEK